MELSLQAELSHGHSSMNERRGRGGGCAIVEGRFRGSELEWSVSCHSGKETSLHFSKHVQGNVASIRFFLEGALLGLGVAGTGH